MTDTDRAHEILERRNRSRDWMENAFYAQWLQVFKSYLCERDPEPDPNQHGDFSGSGQTLYDASGRPLDGKKSRLKTSIGMPDTWAVVRRYVARTTAQPPNLRFRSADAERATRVSRKIMRDWDRGGVQREQKKHVTQAALFGWSVRAWYWEKNTYQRKRRADPYDPATWPMLWQQYRQPLMELWNQWMPTDEAERPLPPGGPIPNEILAALAAEHGRAGLLPVEYEYTGYEGAKCEFLLAADCFPEPNFTSIQKSNWFIVNRLRNRRWLEDLAKAYPDLAKNVEALLTDKPDGTQWTPDEKDFRSKLEGAVDRSTQYTRPAGDKTQVPEWQILEQHVPGPEPKLAYVCADGTWIGEIEYPYELEGKVAFTEAVLIDSLLSGIGDSTARVMRGLQLLHDRQTNVRFDLVYNILRPLVGCTDQRIIEHPELIKRHSGMRLVPLGTHGAIQIIGEQAAMAAVAVGLQDEGAVERQIQKASGETNMSMAANVDPSQNRTATGARIMAYAADILSKDGIDMFNETVIKPDAEMIFMLNRWELSQPQKFDGAPYRREFTAEGEAPPKQEMIEVTPLDFQDDGDIEPELGSTLADDDETKVNKAVSLMGALQGHPMVNQQKLIETFLRTMGEGPRLHEWIQPPPPEEPKAEPPRITISLSPKWEFLSDEQRNAVMKLMGLPEGEPPAMPPPGTPSELGAAVAPPPEAPPEEPPITAAAGMAAQGKSPLPGANQMGAVKR